MRKFYHLLKAAAAVLTLAVAATCLCLPALAETDSNIASQATVSVSYKDENWGGDPEALKSDSVPSNSADNTGGFYTNWNKTDEQYVQYDFTAPKRISGIKVYWYDDGDGSQVPTAADVRYYNGTDYVKLDDVPLEKDKFNEVTFSGSVDTTSLRIYMTGGHPTNTPGYVSSCGVLRWQVLGKDVPAAPAGSNIAPKATVSASYHDPAVGGTLEALQSTVQATASIDKDDGFYTNWPKADTQYVQYDFAEPQTISSVKVFWYDDGDGSQVPTKAVLKYFDGIQYTALGEVPLEKDTYNELTFPEVNTYSLQLEVTGGRTAKYGTAAIGIKRWEVYGYESDEEPGVYRAISGVTATASSTWGWLNVNNIVNQSGITYAAGESPLTGVHDNSANCTSMWHAADGVKPEVTFDLGYVRQGIRMLVWNHNQNDPVNPVNEWERGFKDVEIYYSTDGDSWNQLGGDNATYTFAMASGQAGQAATNLVGGRPVDFGNEEFRYVKIKALSNYGGDTYGLAEVMFAAKTTDPVVDSLYLTPKTLQNGNNKTKVELSGFKLDGLNIQVKAVSEDGKTTYVLDQTVSTEKNQGSTWLRFPDAAIQATEDTRYKVYASVDGGATWSQAYADLLIRKPYDSSITENEDQQKMQAARMAYTEDRFGIFMHFNMGTFNDAEWVLPARDVKSFNPSELDCEQWVKAIASSGAKFAVLTTKHHDGFCLWDSKYTEYDIASSSTPDEDVLKDFTEACRKYGIKPVFYFSIWDRQRGIGGYDVRDITEEDMNYMKGQLTELLTQYGDIAMIMFDGYGWGSSHGSPSFMEIRELIRTLQPNCMVSDINGISTPWNMDVLFYEAPLGAYCPPDNYVTSHQGTLLQSAGWFWHPYSRVTNTAENVAKEISLLESRYCNFLLNVAPNNKGKFDDDAVATLARIGELYEPDTEREQIITPDISMLHPIQTKSATASSNAQDAWKVFDGYSDLGRYQQWVSSGSLPQSVTIDLGSVHDNINALTYVPTPRNLKGTPSNEDKAGLPGTITKYNVYVSTDGETFTEVVHEGLWDTTNQIKIATFASTSARYVKLEAVEAVGGYAVIDELEAGSASIPAVSAEKPNLLNAVTLNGKLIDTFTIDDETTRVDLAIGNEPVTINAIPMFDGVTYEVTQPTKESQQAVIRASYVSNGKTYERTYTINFQPYDFELVYMTETASSSTNFVNDASKTMNRSSMVIDREHPENSTHGTGSQYMWLSVPTDADPWLRYDLGGVKKLDTMYIWNYNDPWNLNSGFRNVVIEYSVDGQTWTKLQGEQADGSFEFAQATGEANLKATNLTNGQPVDFGGVEARYVRLTPDTDPAKGTWGSTNTYGLSEVLFVARREKTVEPEPETFSFTVEQTTGGAITPATATVTQGDAITFTITPDEGYEIADVLVDGKSVGKVESYTFEQVDKAHTIKAVFSKKDSGQSKPPVNPGIPILPIVPSEPEENGYDDVPVGSWYYDAVSYVSEHGLMDGVGNGKFNPDGAVTRAMVWTVLARMAGEETEGGATWYAKAQSWAMRTGVSDGSNPMDAITREQLAAMLYRYEGSPAVSGNLSAYPDANTVSDWAVDAMIWATQEGIINGMNGYLKPQDGATRAQLAAMLQRR